MNVRELAASIQPIGAAATQAATRRQGSLTKPPGSLGRLEALSIQLAGIRRSEQPQASSKAIVIAAGDHGMVAQRISAYPQSVTAEMVLNFLAGGAAVNVMARHAGVRLVIVDAGVASDLPAVPALRSLRIGRGTADITSGPAMTRQQAERCILEGAAIAEELAQEGVDVIGTGDMGIGNTTASSAIASAITGQPPERTTGRGTGRTLAELRLKKAVVQAALDANHPDPEDALDVLAKVGGFEIGVLAGVVLGAAAARRPVVIDGFISGAAALIATGISPPAGQYLIAAHRSAENGHRVVLRHLGIKPLLDLGMRLGEGTGAVLAMGLVAAAAACLSEMATFKSAGVGNRADA